MPATLIAEEEFLAEVRNFRESAFRFEAQEAEPLGDEREEFAQFLAGHPREPMDIDWWRPWLDRVRQFTREGKTISRVRVLADPPTAYQQWLLWAVRAHDSAGEDIRYLARGVAAQIPLPLADDWWLLDNERVILMRPAADGEPGRKVLITDPAQVARYRLWRDAALAYASPADYFAAA